MFIYITRHGETKWNDAGKTQGVKNISLTGRGRDQANKLARRLKNEPIQFIYSSDLKRAVETASIIGDEIGRDYIVTPYLREANFGGWEGYTLKEIEERYPGQLDQWYKDPDFCAPDGESINRVKQRIKYFIDLIKKQNIKKEQGILVVSHALTSKILITELLGLPVSFIKKIKQSNTGLTIIQAIPDEGVLILHNDTCHLKW
ncbi:MAG: histidine phosphatase family protein [Clostridiales bacterium]|nr:histidine phosphatase family protein [Clostridiales bacterium]